MARRLPPLNAVRTFEAAARLLSFKAAAEELRVTPQAVSQQVRVLEGWLQAELFVRRNRAIELTAAGRAFLPAVGAALDGLAAAATGLSQRSQPHVVTINASPTFAVRWLIPRLGRFRTALPDLDYRLTMSNSLPDFAAGAIDVAIHWRDAARLPGLQSDFLMALDIVPVCSPGLLGGRRIDRAQDLLDYPLIRHRDDSGLWTVWFQVAGCGRVELPEGPAFDSDLYIVEAAAEGYGICLVTRAEVARDLQAGRLVVPHDVPIPGGEKFFVVHAAGRAAEPKIAALRHWLFHEYGDEQRRWDGFR